MPSSKHQDFTAHYEDFKDKIYSFFYYRTDGNGTLSEDLTSDTFLKAFRKFDQYDAAYAFSTWIYTIARNTFTDYLRTQKQNKSLEDLTETAHEPGTDDFEDWNADMDHETLTQRIIDALKNFPPLQKDVLIMKYLQDLETAEIAVATDQTPANVRQALSRGKKRLAPMLKRFMTLCLIALLSLYI